MPECRFCGATNLIPKYRRVEDHPGYELAEGKDEDGDEWTQEQIDGVPITFDMRANNSWGKDYPGSPYYCPTCKMAVFIEEDYDARIKRL